MAARKQQPAFWWGDPTTCDAAPEPVVPTPDPNEFFYRDLERMNAKFRQLGAVKTTNDGFTYIDESVIPAALASAYRLLGRYGYANGLLDTAQGDAR